MHWSSNAFAFEIFSSLARVSGVLCCLQEVKCLVPVFPLIYNVVSVLVRLWSFLLIPGFVSANFKFELIVRDKCSSLLVLFLSCYFSLLLIFLFTRVYIVCLYVCVGASIHLQSIHISRYLFYYENFWVCFCPFFFFRLTLPSLILNTVSVVCK